MLSTSRFALGCKKFRRDPSDRRESQAAINRETSRLKV